MGKKKLCIAGGVLLILTLIVIYCSPFVLVVCALFIDLTAVSA